MIPTPTRTRGVQEPPVIIHQYASLARSTFYLLLGLR
jgi:hypothetical protein